MRKNLVVGILRETKAGEYRAPLEPSDVKWLIKRGIAVEVESSSERIFSDREYKKSGARIVNDFRNANLLLGIKEPSVGNLYENKIYMVFSHTTKGQFKNVALLKACIKKRVTLIDYEKIVDLHGKRLVYFGRFAGICGIVDSLHYLGKKLEWEGIRNPFLSVQPAYKYRSLKAIKKAMAEVDKQIQLRGFGAKLSPFIIGVTGHGNVSKGVLEILNLLNSLEVHPRNMLTFFRHEKRIRHRIFKIVFLREEKFRSKDGKGFYFEEFLNNPKSFESNLDRYLPYLNALIHGGYWDKRYPRLVTKEMIQRLTKKRAFRLKLIGDISCDINGSIELTYKATNYANPTFTYDFKNKKFIDGYDSKGITILSIDNLPSELPRDASIEFSHAIREYVYAIAAHGAVDVADHIALPREIRNAVVMQNGKLTGRYGYLKEYFSHDNL